MRIVRFRKRGTIAQREASSDDVTKGRYRRHTSRHASAWNSFSVPETTFQRPEGSFTSMSHGSIHGTVDGRALLDICSLMPCSIVETLNYGQQHGS